MIRRSKPSRNSSGRIDSTGSSKLLKHESSQDRPILFQEVVRRLAGRYFHKPDQGSIFYDRNQMFLQLAIGEITVSSPVENP